MTFNLNNIIGAWVTRQTYYIMYTWYERICRHFVDQLLYASKIMQCLILNTQFYPFPPKILLLTPVCYQPFLLLPNFHIISLWGLYILLALIEFQSTFTFNRKTQVPPLVFGSAFHSQVTTLYCLQNL